MPNYEFVLIVIFLRFGLTGKATNKGGETNAIETLFLKPANLLEVFHGFLHRQYQNYHANTC